VSGQNSTDIKLVIVILLTFHLEHLAREAPLTYRIITKDITTTSKMTVSTMAMEVFFLCLFCFRIVSK